MAIHVNVIITIFIVKINKSLKAHLGLFGGKIKKKADFESLKGNVYKGGNLFLGCSNEESYQEVL